MFGGVFGLLPGSVTMKLARKSISDYSAAIGHDLSYRLDWATDLRSCARPSIDDQVSFGSRLVVSGPVVGAS